MGKEQETSSISCNQETRELIIDIMNNSLFGNIANTTRVLIAVGHELYKKDPQKFYKLLEQSKK